MKIEIPADVEIPPDVEVRPAVQCTECGGWLVATESIRRRMGTTCAGEHSARRPPRGMDPLPGMEALPEAT